MKTTRERLALAQCRQQRLQPVPTTREGEVIGVKRGRVFAWSMMPSRLARTSTAKALEYFRFMLAHSARVNTYGFTVSPTLQSFHNRLSDDITPVANPLVILV